MPSFSPKPLAVLSVTALAALSCAAAAARPGRGMQASAAPSLAVSGSAPAILSSSSSRPSLGGPGKTSPDSFILYGGPGTPEGKFETFQGVPDWQGWFGVDLTEVPPRWQISTFNAANLDATPGNHAFWVGREAAQEPGWATPPGYGNDWDDRLEGRFPVADSTQPTTVRLRFVFNYDTEPSYDFFRVEWDSAGSMRTLATFDGSNRDSTGSFASPAVFEQTFQAPSSSYVGASGNEVHLRLRFTSDGAWSDEDGLWPTDGGAQVDDIEVLFDGAMVTQADFEPGGSDGGWSGVLVDFFGDFSKVRSGFDDEGLDPCRDNSSSQATFIDDGTPPRNDPLARSTGGATSALWSYGFSGGWVVNPS